MEVTEGNFSDGIQLENYTGDVSKWFFTNISQEESKDDWDLWLCHQWYWKSGPLAIKCIPHYNSTGILEIHSWLHSEACTEEWTESLRSISVSITQYMRGYKQITEAKSIIVQLIDHLVLKISIRTDCSSGKEGGGACTGQNAGKHPRQASGHCRASETVFEIQILLVPYWLLSIELSDHLWMLNSRLWKHLMW